MSETVETVRGPIEVAQMGRTLMHEHIFVLDPVGAQELRPLMGSKLLGRGARDRERSGQARRLHDVGIDTLVDPTVLGIGRYVPASRS